MSNTGDHIDHRRHNLKMVLFGLCLLLLTTGLAVWMGGMV